MLRYPVYFYLISGQRDPVLPKRALPRRCTFNDLLTAASFATHLHSLTNRYRGICNCHAGFRRIMPLTEGAVGLGVKDAAFTEAVSEAFARCISAAHAE
jgi:hypothetical protein